jgi:hypothetical protein
MVEPAIVARGHAWAVRASAHEISTIAHAAAATA